MHEGLRKKRVFLFVLFTGLAGFFLPLSFAQKDWNAEKSKHFIVYYKNAPGSYIQELSSRAETCYEEITGYLGYKGFDFWTWEDRCKIYIYDNRQDYLDATGSARWARAHVDVKERQINSYFGQDIFYNIILPHELAHIIFRAFVGFEKKLPLCLEEGIACNQEEDYSKRLELAEAVVERGLNRSFADLLNYSPGKIENPVIFYSQCASIVDFLINRFGRRRFVSLCRLIRDQDSWPDSLLKVYRFDSLGDFEQRWLEFLKERSD